MPIRTPRPTLRDFGFDPSESPYHFVLGIDAASATFVERFEWHPDEHGGFARQPVLKAVLDRYRWSRVSETVAEVFNRRLRAAGFRASAWKESETLIAPYFGKELILLAWAIEGADPTLIPNMLANWVGLAPEERWWLYTTINATAGHPEHGRDRGWRKAIKIAFAENPANPPPSALLRDDPSIAEAHGRYRVLPPAPPPTPRRRGQHTRPTEETQFELPTSIDVEPTRE